jgi:hypothetical protein
MKIFLPPKILDSPLKRNSSLIDINAFFREATVAQDCSAIGTNSNYNNLI